MALSKLVWLDGKFISLEAANVNIFSPSLQYGWSGFEGVRFYNTRHVPAVFRLPEHIDRFFYTAKALRIDLTYSAEELTGVICQLISLNQMTEGYIRPCILCPEAELGLRFKSKKVTCAIALSSWDKKMRSEALRAKISPVVRIHPESSDVNAKINGHYVNSIRALYDAQDSGYDEAILLDHRGYVAEGSSENIFIVKNGDLFTPPLGTILPGITRDTIITLAQDYSYKVCEKDLTPDDLFTGDEVFLCGTAMEILAAVSIDDKIIGNGKSGELTQSFTNLYARVVCGRMKSYHRWLTFVNEYK